MPELTQLNRVKPTTTVIDLGDGDQVRVTFDRNKITSAWQDENQMREDSDSHGLAKALASVILSWDVTENEQPLASDAENIGRLSIPAQGALLRKILTSSVPASEEGNGSSEPSSTPSTASTEPQQTHQNGPAPSPSPELSASQSPT